MDKVIQLIKELKFLGYSEEDILKMVQECLPMKFDY
jgi:DNA-binding transcriptional regulator YhcF (GntR family)